MLVLGDLICTFGFRLVVVFLVLVPDTYVLCLLHVFYFLLSCGVCVMCFFLAEWPRFLMLCLSPVNHLCYWRQWFTLSFVYLVLYMSVFSFIDCTELSSLLSHSCNCNPLAWDACRAVTVHYTNKTYITKHALVTNYLSNNFATEHLS